MGRIDWIRPFGNFLHIGGFASGNGLCIAGMATTCDFHVMNEDGLALPGFSTNSAWLDHVQALDTFVDHAGKLNAIVTDCTRSCNDWVRLDKCDIRKTHLARDNHPGARGAAGRPARRPAGAGTPASRRPWRCISRI